MPAIVVYTISLLTFVMRACQKRPLIAVAFALVLTSAIWGRRDYFPAALLVVLSLLIFGISHYFCDAMSRLEACYDITRRCHDSNLRLLDQEHPLLLHAYDDVLSWQTKISMWFLRRRALKGAEAFAHSPIYVFQLTPNRLSFVPAATCYTSSVGPAFILVHDDVTVLDAKSLERSSLLALFRTYHEFGHAYLAVSTPESWARRVELSLVSLTPLAGTVWWPSYTAAVAFAGAAFAFSLTGFRRTYREIIADRYAATRLVDLRAASDLSIALGRYFDRSLELIAQEIEDIKINRPLDATRLPLLREQRASIFVRQKMIIGWLETYASGERAAPKDIAVDIWFLSVLAGLAILVFGVGFEPSEQASEWLLVLCIAALPTVLMSCAFMGVAAATLNYTLAYHVLPNVTGRTVEELIEEAGRQ